MYQGDHIYKYIYSEVRNSSTSLFTKQTLGISDFHFKVGMYARARARAAPRRPSVHPLA